ncbi:hypothetical protein JCM21900_001828 [Sporobolomyces salmonicolor]
MNMASATTASSTGFLTSRLVELPSAVSILVGVLLIVRALGALGAGARSIFAGRGLARIYGSREKKGWLQGGVGGMLFGSNCVSVFAILLTLLVVSRQSSARLSASGTLAITLCPGLLGAVAGGRWTWASEGKRSSRWRDCSLSLMLLFTTSFHISTILPRLVLLALSLLLAFLAPTQRFVLPALATLCGAWLLVLGIDVFIRYGFVDALRLLVAEEGVGRDGRERGMRAWQGFWGLGTEGDKLWNAYLTQFVPAHSSQPLGSHSPPATLSERLESFLTLSFLKRCRPGGTFTDLPRRTLWHADGADEIESFDIEKGFAQTNKKRSFGRSHREQEPSNAWDSDADRLAGLGGRLVRPSTTTTASVADKKAVRKKGSSSGIRGLSGSTAASFAVAAVVAEKGSRQEEKVEQKEVEKADEESEAVASLATLAKGLITTSNTNGSEFKHFFDYTTRGKKPASYSGFETSEREIPPPNAIPATPSLFKGIKRARAVQREACKPLPLAKEESKDGDARVGKVGQVDEPSMSLKHESEGK